MRGLHPMMAERMDLWRLRELRRSSGCPSAQDVYLFRAVARENPRDERLVALAEVRDLTPVRDEARPHHRAARARADGAPGVRGDALASRRAGRRASGC